jgi:hypothetical protein
MADCARCGSDFSGPGTLCRPCASRTTQDDGRTLRPTAAHKHPPIHYASDPRTATLTADRASFSTTGESASRRTPLSSVITGSTLHHYGAGSDQKDPLIGQRPLGQYEILGKIGEGAFGAVYLAEQPSVRRKAGLNVEFAPEDRWDRLVILSPQPPARVRAEVATKASAMKDAILVPDKTVGQGRVISASVPRSRLGAGDPSKWGYQVLVQSNEGYPGPVNLLTRLVNAVASAHRFGGGVDGDCDPHVMDLLAGDGRGEVSEAEAQHSMLKYECYSYGRLKTIARLQMVYQH